MGLDKKLLDPEIDLASNGQEALEKVQALHQEGKNYGLVITDCSMPIMDGYRFSVETRSFYDQEQVPQPLIFALTGNTDPDSIERAWNSGIDEILIKPTTTQEIRGLLEEVLVVY
jgi:CheY-like chemotaxis protein